jgi:hypothetical protein
VSRLPTPERADRTPLSELEHSVLAQGRPIVSGKRPRSRNILRLRVAGLDASGAAKAFLCALDRFDPRRPAFGLRRVPTPSDH